MAKAKRIKTRYPNVYRVGDRYEWIGRHPGSRGMADSATEARDEARWIRCARSRTTVTSRSG
jgi:hypothetical protein